MCLTYPDEKGIETSVSAIYRSLSPHLCLTYPDEKGIETGNVRIQVHCGLKPCLTYPDEKGIETSSSPKDLTPIPDSKVPDLPRREGD